MDWDQVWVGAHIATLCEGGEPYGALHDHAIAVKGERIAWIGSAAIARQKAEQYKVPVHAADGLWITPGLIDCHTHVVYGGDRVAEFEQRLGGVSYEAIARVGGGIQATVKSTRAASNEALLAASLGRVQQLMREGVTTLEIKSGYGLDLGTEKRMLEVARQVAVRLPVTVKTTYLGLHALPVEYRSDRRAYVNQVSGPWLQSLAAAGLVDAVDAFCENIAFTLDETAQFLQAAQDLGLPSHIHAGQLSDMGATELAAKFSALSVDHLEYVSQAGIDLLAVTDAVAVLLPGAYYFLRQTTPPPVAMLRRAGVPMAIASDCNPGSSPCTSLLLILNMACTLFGLTPEEALCGVTRNAARALGAYAEIGTLEIGKRADFALWKIDRPAELAYGLGANPCVGVVYRGHLRA